jgi:hypothetical protein
MGNGLRLGVALWAVISAPAAADDKGLDDAVKAYFEARRLADREELAGQIEGLAGGDADKVGAALRRVRLWQVAPGANGNFSIATSSGATHIGTYQLADGYDFSKPHRVIVCMPGKEYRAAAILHQAGALLGDVARKSVLVCSQWPGTDSFHQPGPTAGYLGMLMRSARKRIHCDSERTYLFGVGPGADAAWMTALAHPDMFAGVVVLGGYPKLPYPEASYGFMLENLRNTPVLSVWRSAGDAAEGSGAHDVAAANRLIVKLAQSKGLPIKGFELPVDASGGTGRSVGDFGQGSGVPLDEINKLLSQPRAVKQDRVSHWFRYPAQGRSGWLRQVDFKGQVWEDPQLSIVPSADVDRNTFVAETLKDKLAFLGGVIEGQTIDIQTQRCGRIELALTDGLIDWDSEVTISVNGQRRHATRAGPSIRTMLESAYEAWEFQNPARARLQFTVRSDFRDE